MEAGLPTDSSTNTPLKGLPPTHSLSNFRTLQRIEQAKLTALQLKPKAHQPNSLAQEAAELEQQLSSDSSWELYTKVFSKAIAKNAAFGPLLGQIKAEYHRALRGLKCTPHHETNKDLQQTLRVLQGKQHQLTRTGHQLKRELKSTSKKNARLCRAVDQWEGEYLRLQQKFWDTSAENKQAPPSTDEAWRYLLAELQNYESMHAQLETNAKNSAYNSRKLTKLLQAVQARGYSVYGDEDAPEEGTSSVNLVDGPPKAAATPP